MFGTDGTEVRDFRVQTPRDDKVEDAQVESYIFLWLGAEDQRQIQQ